MQENVGGEAEVSKTKMAVKQKQKELYFFMSQNELSPPTSCPK